MQDSLVEPFIVVQKCCMLDVSLAVPLSLHLTIRHPLSATRKAQTQKLSWAVDSWVCHWNSGTRKMARQGTRGKSRISTECPHCAQCHMS